MKTYAQKVIELMNTDSVEAKEAYEEWCVQTDALYNECSDIVKLRMSGFVPKKSYFESKHLSDRMTNAVREASVKYKQVCASLSQELGVEELPFPMMRCAMFMPTLIALQKAVDESKFDVKELQELLRQTKEMAKSLLFEDDRFVKSILEHCDSIVSSKKTKPIPIGYL